MTLSDEEWTVVLQALEVAMDDAETQAESAAEWGRGDDWKAARARRNRFFEIHRKVTAWQIGELERAVTDDE